jgi:hypothetical protein
MRIALLYNPNDKGINGKNWKLNNYRFFREELPRQVELKEYPVLYGFDCSNLDCDAVVLWSLLPKNLVNMQLKNFDKLKCVKITRAPDAWEIDEVYNKTAKELGIDLVMSFQSPNAQYEYLDKNIRYKRFILGIDRETYKCPRNWSTRRKDVILSSGVCPGPLSWTWFYHFRWKCAQHPKVYHAPKRDYLGVNYWMLLADYRAAIACMTLTSVLKYFEIPMCGCLMFAEVTGSNQIKDLGFKDGKNCIYIDRTNYKDRFDQYLSTPDAPVWKEIADAGHKLIINRFTNERQVSRFVSTVASLAAAKSR